ncbi:MAG: zinc-ribbon domain-containing protein [Clostridiales bacterium]|nr:zinc-ribbon domain-containing protein [Clostridiales bacterium]
MFCEKCGTELKDGAKFCAKCGAVQNGGPNASTPLPIGEQTNAPKNVVRPYSQKAPWKKAIIPIIIACLAIALIIFGITRCSSDSSGSSSGFSLIPKKASNPLAVTYDSLKNILKMHSFEYKASMSTMYNVSVEAEGYVSYGNSLDELIVLANLKSTAFIGSARQVLGIYGGYAFTYDESRNTTEVNALEDAYEDVTDDYDEYTEDFDINDIFKNKSLNLSEYGSSIKRSLIKAANDQLSENDIDIEIEMYHIDAMLKIFDNFFYKAMNDEEVQSNVLKNIKSSKKDNLTTYDYDVDLQDFIKEFYTYVLDEIEKDKKLMELQEQLEDISDDEVINYEAILKMARDSLLSELASSELNIIKLSVTVDKSKNLRELEIDSNMEDLFNIEIKLDSINSVKPNTEYLQDMIDQ